MTYLGGCSPEDDLSTANAVTNCASWLPLFNLSTLHRLGVLGQEDAGDDLGCYHLAKTSTPCPAHSSGPFDVEARSKKVTKMETVRDPGQRARMTRPSVGTNARHLTRRLMASRLLRMLKQLPRSLRVSRLRAQKTLQPRG